jgi:cation:H+ antiporter
MNPSGLSPLWWAVGQFIICSLAILWSGVRLARYGDAIGERTGLGGSWVGLILLATVTSLPELVTGVSSVLQDLPDIAAGDAIGSCMFNLLILALLDVRHPMPLSTRVHQGHLLSAGFGLAMLGLLTLALLAGPQAPSIGPVGLYTLVFLALYGLAARSIFVFERHRPQARPDAETIAAPASGIPMTAVISRFTLAAGILVAAASFLPAAAEHLADATGLGQTFVGTLFVAATTSLPEIVVSMTALHFGALDMAVANLFGSNLFNVAVVAIDDLAYTPGPLLAAVSPAHQFSAVAAMTMTGFAVIGLTFRASRKRFRLSWDSIGIVGVYAITVWLLAART